MSVFEDKRGKIEDLLGPVDAVTRIHTVKDAIRGNHFHEHTTQWTYILSGRLLMATGVYKHLAEPGKLVLHNAGEAHAWKALEDTDCLVFTKGPRSGENYESDVIRLEEPLLS